MANPIARLYETEDNARDAVARLREVGVAEGAIIMLTPGGEGGSDSTAALARAVNAGRVIGDRAGLYADRVAHGRSLVVVEPPFGLGLRATEALDACHPVDTELRSGAAPDPWGPGAPFSATISLPVLVRDNPAPFSRFAGFPTLSSTEPLVFLASSNFAVSSLFGIPLLSRIAAPLSSLINLPTLTGGKGGYRAIVPLPMLTNVAAPFSAMLGLPRLWNSPTPLSSLLSLPLLARSR